MRIFSTKLENAVFPFAFTLRSSSSNRYAIRATNICDLTAFGLVPTKVFTLRFCLSSLKKISMSHLLLYSSAIVAAYQSRLLVMISSTVFFSSWYTATRLRVSFSSLASLAFVPVR